MTEGNDWLDRLGDSDPPPVDARRARRRLVGIVVVALTVVAVGITVGLLVTPPMPECVPLSAEAHQRLVDQAADQQGARSAVAVSGLCGTK
ncbi:hypothetical protein [Alloactinosynnema sp. L-07]|uniref:hypothetical protein n=1 Tax=Alloactinosynnema sp. L-07 TaxID=1653480 RepID=UPI00065F01F3|nr:hypothetical protein [Alloactinosynnema sp. L-07]CRK60680.1 hypothetical protein [Alloactinosynnema sp. L-07]